MKRLITILCIGLMLFTPVFMLRPADATVSSADNKLIYTGDGSTTVFPYTFPIFDDTDLVVTLVVTATGAETTQTITTHYTVSGAGDAAGGNVTMVTSPSTAQQLVVRRVMPFTQGLDLVDNTATSVENYEDAFDKAVMMIQQLGEVTDRSLKAGLTSTTDLELPSPVANYLLAWNADGDGITNVVGGMVSSDTVISTGSTTSRTLADRFADPINVLDYGAVGDGITDDTAAIQAAIDSAYSGTLAPNYRGGAVVIVPKGATGNYLLSSTLYLRTGVQLIGQGGFYKIRLLVTGVVGIDCDNYENNGPGTAGSNRFGFYNTKLSNFAIRLQIGCTTGLKWRGRHGMLENVSVIGVDAGDDGQTDDGHIGIQLWGDSASPGSACFYNTFKNVQVAYINGSGIEFEGSINVAVNRLENCYVVYCWDGFLVNGDALAAYSRANTFISCDATSNYNEGWQINGRGNLLLSCWSENNASGYMYSFGAYAYNNFLIACYFASPAKINDLSKRVTLLTTDSDYKTALTRTFTDGDTTPSIYSPTWISGVIWITGNTAPTTITALDDGVTLVGRSVTIVFGDSTTTIDFTGTTLKGTGGVDWDPDTGDHMTCITNGTNWYCTLSDNTP